MEGTLTDSEAEATLRDDDGGGEPAGPTGPNDDRLRRDVPPHHG